MKKLFLPLLLVVAVSAQGAENPVLKIEGGQVQGVVADDHPDVFVYRGIPYAAPPIRENRWKAPQPVVPWKGVKHHFDDREEVREMVNSWSSESHQACLFGRVVTRVNEVKK